MGNRLIEVKRFYRLLNGGVAGFNLQFNLTNTIVSANDLIHKKL